MLSVSGAVPSVVWRDASMDVVTLYASCASFSEMLLDASMDVVTLYASCASFSEMLLAE
jgi:hypothetical protein